MTRKKATPVPMKNVSPPKKEAIIIAIDAVQNTLKWIDSMESEIIAEMKKLEEREAAITSALQELQKMKSELGVRTLFPSAARMAVEAGLRSTYQVGDDYVLKGFKLVPVE